MPTPGGSADAQGSRASAATRSLLSGVEPERAGRRELAELVTDHRLRDVDGHVLAPVVHGDGVAHHLRDDRGAARPRLDDALLVGRVEVVHLLEQVAVHERTLLEAAGHGRLPPGAAGPAATDDELVGVLALRSGAAFGLTPRRHRMASARGLPPPPP